MTEDQKILVAPRHLFSDYKWFTPWKVVGPNMDSIIDSVKWINRAEAEESSTLVQLIPCAVVRDHDGNICVLRRIRSGRFDLRSKITFTFGGHVDRTEKFSDLPSLLLGTLKRELEEEVGIRELNNLEPIGLVMDISTIAASRHVAFIYDVTIDTKVNIYAIEEFSTRSKYNAIFLSLPELTQLHTRLDPWSRILFEELINPKGAKPKGRQLGLMLEI